MSISIVINTSCNGEGFGPRTVGAVLAKLFLGLNRTRRNILAAAYDPMYYLYTGRKAVRPWIHRPETYFYPYGNASPDLGSVEEIRNHLEELGVRFLIVNPLEGYSERVAVAELFDNLVQSYAVRPELVFESTDQFHRIYALPAQTGKSLTRSLPTPDS